MAGKQGATYMKRNIASTSHSGIIIPVLHFIRFQMFFIQWNVYYHTVTVSAWSAISCSHSFRKWHDVEIGLKILNTNTSKINVLTVFACSLCINFTAVWVIFLNNEKCVFLLFPDGIWTPRLSGRPFQHHNVQFYCISNLFKNTMILTPNTPKNYQGQKFSLSLSLSHLKEHNCLSLIQLQKKKKEKKNSRNLVVSKWTGGENCAFLPWPWSGIVVSETPHRRCRHHQANMSCVLIIHRSEWRLLHDSDRTLYSFLAMFIFVSLFFC